MVCFEPANQVCMHLQKGMLVIWQWEFKQNRTNCHGIQSHIGKVQKIASSSTVVVAKRSRTGRFCAITGRSGVRHAELKAVRYLEMSGLRRRNRDLDGYREHQKKAKVSRLGPGA